MSLRFSIIIPSYRHAQFLRQALDSVFAQSYQELEVWVIDGGSDDGTVEVLKQYSQGFPNLHWVSEPDEGPADAVNKGLSRVSGDIIGIHSADDVYYRDSFHCVAEFFSAHPQCGFVYGDVDGIDLENRIEYRRKFPEFSWEAMFGMSMCIAQGSIFFRKSVAERTGFWNPDIYGCDLDYWMRLMFRTEARHIPVVLSGWRRYPEQRTRPDQSRRIWDGYWKMIEQAEEVCAAPENVQRLATASKHLLAIRFPPKFHWWVIWRHIFLGWCLHPGYWRYNHPLMTLSALLPITRRFRLALKRARSERRGDVPAYAPVATFD